MFATFVRYPTGSQFVMGATETEVEHAAQRLAEHSRMYGSDPRCAGYIFDVETKTVVAEYRGGPSPYRGDEPWIFCPSCLARRVPAGPGAVLCLGCLTRQVAS